jgi:hypothetical protein
MPTGPLPVVASTIKCELILSIGSDLTALTRFFITYSGTAPTGAELITFATSIATAYNVDIAGSVDTDTTLTEVICTDLSSATSPTGVASVSHVGSLGGTYLPADAAMVISYEQPRRYRGGHARGYWRVGVQASQATPQTWGAGFMSSMTTDIGLFFTAVFAAGWSGAGSLSLVQVSYFSGFTVVTNPLTGRARNVPTKRVAAVTNTVSSYVVRARIGSQRRRLGKS